MWICLLFS
jgi:hypothetical protein